MKAFFNYVFFIHKLILKKKNTIIIPILWFVVSIILAITLGVINLEEKVKPLVFYVFIFIEALLTVLFASIKSINIYKDFEEEGIELLTLSKPISRKKIIWGKTLTNTLFAIYWSFVMAISNLIILLVINDLNVVLLTFVTIPVVAISYILFGNLSSLIAFKMNAKVAITAPLVVFSPLVIGGTILSTRSTSTSNNVAYYLNAPYTNHTSGNVPNLEKFYLNNNQDNFYVIPNGYNKNEFRDDQIKYLSKAYEFSKDSALYWQVYSYLSLPYQFVDYFNLDNKSISDAFGSNNSNNLKNYLYYKNNDTYTYNYDLNNNVALKQYKVTDKVIKKQDNSGNYVKDQNGLDIIDSRVNKVAYLVPGSLKSYSHIDNLLNTNIIYARENAESFKIEFPEDKFVHSTSDNLVGELKWDYIKELLENKIFIYYAHQIVKSIKENLKEIDQDNKEEVKSIIFRTLETFLADKNFELLRVHDINSIVLNFDSLESKKIKTLSEKKIYLATAFIYYIYLTYNNSYLTDALLFNVANQNEDPHSYNILIDDFRYNIGGYGSYTAKQEIQVIPSERDEDKSDRKVIIRYDLQKSDNYLFQPLDQVWQISRNKTQTVDKNYYFLIWIALGTVFVLLNNKLYYKKDYR
ncbi:ABC transporter permease [Mycoplasmopsis edwardii]|uniref:ABC transporter permease n=1 Tax=Mycoplasmopsis edwardii TaxID=53558 RepID=A0ACD4PI18_9BACT|nr:ABC transporter permease [Mycoplasmopsis edwardii]WBP84324.1 ABC transporter permease [Mycoplasmopsis edwardii]